MRNHITFFAAVFSALLLLSCSSEKNTEIAAKDGYIAFTGNGSSNYTICGPSTLKSNMDLFAAALQKVTGASVPVAIATTSNNQDREIIIGKTAARPEAAAALEGISCGYAIKVSGRKLIIAGTDETWTVLGMEMFAKSFFKNNETCHDGTLEIPNDYLDTKVDDDPQFIARFIKENRSFSLYPTLYGTVPQEGVYKVAQGAASDGQYFYVVMKGNETSANSSQCVVYKYSISPFKRIATSKEFDGHHANDMTFDTKNKRALVVNGSGASGTLTALDAETLEISTIKTSLGIGGMTYNAQRNIYGITQGGTKYQTADENFNMIKNYGRSDGKSATYTAQGMGSDDSYVYFPMSPKSGGASDNILCTYDWDGNYITDLHINLNLESESMFYTAGRYFVNFHSAGARLYLITPVITFTY